MTDQVIEQDKIALTQHYAFKLFGPEVLRGEGRHPSSK